MRAGASILVVKPPNILRNLERSRCRDVLEPHDGLAPTIGRDRAHELFLALSRRRGERGGGGGSGE